MSPRIEVMWPPANLHVLRNGTVVRSALVLAIDDVGDVKHALLVSGLTEALVHVGVELFVIVGEDAESFHDELDARLEARHLEHVLTTWHSSADHEDIADFVSASVRAHHLERVVLALNVRVPHGIALEQEIVRALAE